MSQGSAQLLALLDLERIEVNIFRGSSIDEPHRRVFGGQVAAQAIVAAGRTVERGRIHSLHAYFLRPGDPSHPILYEVDRIRDGRSFTTRRVVAIQHGEAIFNLQCSFHVAESGLIHQEPMPEAPDPEGLELFGAPGTVPLGIDAPRTDGLDIAFTSDPRLGVNPDGGYGQRLWLKTSRPLPDEPLLHAAFVAYASDLTLVGTIAKRHGMLPWDEAVMGVSLDHCMWFHGDFRADEWLLYDQVSPAAAGARGLALGGLYTRAGARVVTVAQEGLIRVEPRR